MGAAEDASAGGRSTSNSRSAAVSAIELVFGRLVAARTVGGWEEAEEEGEPRATLGLGSSPPPAQGYLICLGNRYFQRGTQEGRRARLEGQRGNPRLPPPPPPPACAGLQPGRREMHLRSFPAAAAERRLGSRIGAALLPDALPAPPGTERP